jgi:hypothetical protein
MRYTGAEGELSVFLVLARDPEIAVFRRCMSENNVLEHDPVESSGNVDTDMSSPTGIGKFESAVDLGGFSICLVKPKFIVGLVARGTHF